MGLFRRSASSTSSSEVRRPVLDPDSRALIYVTPAEGADAATVDRMLASARAELDALEGRLAQHRDEIG